MAQSIMNLNVLHSAISEYNLVLKNYHQFFQLNHILPAYFCTNHVHCFCKDKCHQ